MPTSVFIHGLEGSSRGTKARYFRKHFPQMHIDDFKGTMEQRMKRLEALLRGRKELILVGSSLGGLMAAVYGLEHSKRVQRLVLLAPALTFREFKPYTCRRTDVSTKIYHGSRDTVISPATVRLIARGVFLNLDFQLVDDDHLLTKTFKTIDWRGLFEDDAGNGRNKNL